MATREQIEALEDNWLADPCWDIHTTEGFEEHAAELATFQLQQQAQWEKERHDARVARMRLLRLVGQDALYDYLLTLERRLDGLERRLERYEGE